jgi:hypothetical protein
MNWETRSRSSMRADLEPIRDLLVRLGNPHRRFLCVHVTGTKRRALRYVLEHRVFINGLRTVVLR